MNDQNANGIPDNVEIAAAEARTHEADAHKAEAEAKKSGTDLEKAKLPYQVPLYDRIVMRLAIPFALAFAAPIATYYFGSKASAGLESVERFEKTAERLERLVVESELRVRLTVDAHTQPSTPSDVATVQSRVGVLAEEYMRQVQQEPDLDKFLKDRDQDQHQLQLQAQQEGR